MKTTINQLMKISAFAIVIALILAVAISCKKASDEDPTPGPVPLPTPDYPVVFKDRAMNLMTKDEMTNNKHFIGSTFRMFGKGIAGEDSIEIPESIKDIGHYLWQIHEYEHAKKDTTFKGIYDNLNSINAQITALQTGIADLGKEIQIQTNQLEDFFTTQEIQTQYNYLATQLDSGTVSEFMYYPSLAAKYQQDPVTWAATMKDASIQLLTYSHDTYYATGPGSMVDVIQQLKGLMIPAAGSMLKNALHTFNTTLIPLAYAKEVYNDSSTAMITYQILENYFLWIVGTQFQCENILVNSANVIDSANTMHYAQTLYTAFKPVITQEVDVFLKEVNFFVANLDEYRNAKRWNNDVQYAGSGLTSDEIFVNVLARAQFLANTLYSAVGADHPVMCGRIITPMNYSNGNGSLLSSLTLNLPQKTITANAVHASSWIPYTYWQGTSSPNTCHYDTTWSVFSFGTMGQSDPGFGTGPIKVSLNCPDNQTPWTHSSPTIEGTVSVFYYNPMDLNDKQLTYDSVHDMQFGFFSYNWKWGFLYLRYGQGFLGTNFSTPEFPWIFQCNMPGPGQLLECGKDAGYYSDNSPYVMTTDEKDQGCTYPNNTQFFTFNKDIGVSQIGYNGYSLSTNSKGSTSYVSNWEFQFNVGQAVSNTNPIYYAWDAQSMFNATNGPNEVTFRTKGGTGYITPSCAKKENLNINNGFIFSFDHNTPNQWQHQSGYGVANFGVNQLQKTNFGWEIEQTANPYNNPMQVLMYHNVAVVFSGLVGVPE
jgi:hypothetical protein